MHLDPTSILQATGYLGLFLIVFAESGLLIGFFLPGDSLLFAAGFLASQGALDITGLIAVIFTAAVVGDSVGYSIGKRLGPRVFRRKDSIIFSHDHIERSRSFYERHGGKTIILARFTPVVRTFAPVLAGVGKMAYQKFLAYNLLGGLLWSTSVTLLGYYLGQRVPNIEKYLMPVIGLAIAISVVPSLMHLLMDEGRRQAIKERTKNYWAKRRQRRQAKKS